MPVTRTDRNQVWGSGDQEGVLLSEEVVEVDVTEEAVHYRLHEILRAHLAGDATTDEAFTALARLVLYRDGASDVMHTFEG